MYEYKRNMFLNEDHACWIKIWVEFDGKGFNGLGSVYFFTRKDAVNTFGFLFLIENSILIQRSYIYRVNYIACKSTVTIY